MKNDSNSKKLEDIKDKFAKILVDVITDIPESMHSKIENPDDKVKKLIQQAGMKAATLSATLSIPAGMTGVLTSIPDILAVWRIQAQLVSDIAATYGKLALLTQEAMIWCLFRHSAASLLRDVAVRTGSRIVIQKLSFAAIEKLLQKIGLQVSTKFIGKTALKAIPVLGAIGNGAYTFYDTNEVGKTASAYFKSLADNKVEALESDPESPNTEQESSSEIN
ncbi:MAG: EcsC family protein [Fibrobacter sp.]|nr:EcsC family protein [Fibrobacter sp.]